MSFHILLNYYNKNFFKNQISGKAFEIFSFLTLYRYYNKNFYKNQMFVWIAKRLSLTFYIYYIINFYKNQFITFCPAPHPSELNYCPQHYLTRRNSPKILFNQRITGVKARPSADYIVTRSLNILALLG